MYGLMFVRYFSLLRGIADVGRYAGKGCAIRMWWRVGIFRWNFVRLQGYGFCGRWLWVADACTATGSGGGRVWAERGRNRRTARDGSGRASASALRRASLLTVSEEGVRIGRVYEGWRVAGP